MEYNKLVSEMELKQEIEGFYLLKDAFVKTASNGKSFLSGFLADKSGSIELKVWDYSGPVGAASNGKVVKVRGEVSDFKGTPQFVAIRIRVAGEEDAFDASNLVPSAPISAGNAFEDVLAQIRSIRDREYRLVAETMLDRHEKAFRTMPAAKSVHHAFLNGLLMHTSNMMKLADRAAALYPDVIDRDLLLTGTLLHDFAKEKEFTLSELGIVSEYSLQGELLGHLVMGAQEIGEVAREIGMSEEKSLLLQHMILSHHGEPEFGAAVKPAFAEAELLSLIDLIDSRMEIYSETLKDQEIGTFSGRVYSLDKKIYRHF